MSGCAKHIVWGALLVTAEVEGTERTFACALPLMSAAVRISSCSDLLLIARSFATSGERERSFAGAALSMTASYFS